MPECPECGYAYDLDDIDEDTTYDNTRDALASLGLTRRDVDKVLETVNRYKDNEYLD